MTFRRMKWLGMGFETDRQTDRQGDQQTKTDTDLNNVFEIFMFNKIQIIC